MRLRNVNGPPPIPVLSQSVEGSEVKAGATESTRKLTGQLGPIFLTCNGEKQSKKVVKYLEAQGGFIRIISLILAQDLNQILL
ncbi:hypothetical protein B9Z19DRAFT_1087633 [Tuber borchii]|uniref:Uncharacterized protein n=1 Tax=Tuber borchii TaxID=42251 RepID=A0A2T6ZMR8_TUBBO|nr:hypothetical protein B9Z19DRAFT_1087633 [Tuber borchii]